MSNQHLNNVIQRVRSLRPALLIFVNMIAVTLVSSCIGVAPIPLGAAQSIEWRSAVPDEGRTAVGADGQTAEEEKKESENDTLFRDAAPVEQFVTILPLPPELDSPDLEISAMAWYGEFLVLVPQYPEHFDDQVFALKKQQILDFLDGRRKEPLEATPIHFNSGLLRIRIPRLYQGFEAIAFVDNRVYVAVEAGRRADEMVSYIVSGTIQPDLSEIRLDYERYAEIPAQSAIGNVSDEALIINRDILFTIYEANGVHVNPHPVAHVLSPSLELYGTIPFPNIEYRITDATTVDENGRFWAVNYFFPGDKNTLKPREPEAIAALYGEGASHQKLNAVERLVEFQIKDNEVAFSDRPPIQLILLGSDLQQLNSIIGAEISRNWEGIARLDQRGFLLVTDKFPDTLLGFVPLPR